jgi:hypothetical protein
MSSVHGSGSAERLAKELEADLGRYEAARNAYHTFAFWHDVGVTGLGALATLALAVGELTANYSRSIRVFVLFITASITVFASCDHFFKFKAKVEEFGTAAKRVRALQSRVAEARDLSEEGPTPGATCQALGGVSDGPDVGGHRLAGGDRVGVARGETVLVDSDIRWHGVARRRCGIRDMGEWRPERGRGGASGSPDRGNRDEHRVVVPGEPDARRLRQTLARDLELAQTAHGVVVRS